MKLGAPIVIAAIYCAIFLIWLSQQSGILSGSGKVQIQFWNGLTGPAGISMVNIAQKFNEENPDIHVTVQRMQWRTYYNKLFVAGLSQREPEVFIAHASMLPRFERAKFLNPVDDFMAGDNGIDPNDIDSAVWSSVEIDGKHVGLPLDAHPIGMFYNKDILSKAGFVDENGKVIPPKTKDEFLHYINDLKKDFDGNGKVDQWGFAFEYSEQSQPRQAFIALMSQFGGRAFNEDYTKCLLDSPENIAAFEFAKELVFDRKLAPLPESESSWIAFRQGSVGLFFGGVWLVGDLKRLNSVNNEGASLPVLGKRSATWTDSHILCMSSNLSQKKKEAAWRLMKHISDNSLDWTAWGPITIRKSLRKTERFKGMQIQAAFAEQLDNVQYPPKIPYLFEFRREFELAIDRVLRGTYSPKEALQEATRNIDEMIARDQLLYQQIAELDHQN